MTAEDKARMIGENLDELNYTLKLFGEGTNSLSIDFTIRSNGGTQPQIECNITKKL